MTNEIKPLVPLSTDTERLEELAKELLDETPLPVTPAALAVQSTQDYWKVSGVNYKNGIYTVELAKSLLDSGNAKTQDNWAKYTEQAKQNGNFYTGDMPLYHSLFTALFRQKNNRESEEARTFIQKQMRDKWLMTLTRIAYQPKGDDLVIHNYGTKDKYEAKSLVVGADRIIKSGDSKALEAILGTGNIQEINSVYNWINQTPAYIWRVNSNPSKVDERVARFNADADWVNLYCSRDPAGSYPSLGVRLAREARAKK